MYFYSVKKFFDVILEKNLPPLSLTLSKQVMEYREWLFASVQSSKDRINEGFRLLEKSNNLLEAIKKNRKKLDENGSFTYEDYEEKTNESLCQNHINSVIIVYVYAIKYVLGLKERYFLNVHILMMEGAAQSVQEIVQEKLIDIALILSKLRELK